MIMAWSMVSGAILATFGVSFGLACLAVLYLEDKEEDL